MEKRNVFYEKESADYQKRNQIAEANGVVLFGSSFARRIPICELKQAFRLSCNLYNRSLTDLSIFCAEKAFMECVRPLAPKKILLQLGETDLEQGTRSVSDMLQAYEGLIKKLKSIDKHCPIVLVSVCEVASGISPAKWNQQLETLAHRTGCQYADITAAFADDAPCVKAFDLLRFFMLDRISFSDAVML